LSNNIFEEITSYENLLAAFKHTQKGKTKFKKEAITFRENQTYNLLNLQKELINETYTFGKYEKFKVFEPKERLIHAPSYKDKVVQIAINNILKKVYFPSFIFDSYACIDKKGTHKCVERIQHFMKKSNWENGKNSYIIKIDIKKFFYTIDRTILKKIISKKIKCKKTLRLLHKIIDSANIIDTKGLPLGNTLSQIFGNIYMNELDQYAKRKLGIKYYIRYVDDIIIFVKDKKEAKKTLWLLKNFINKNLNLKENLDKTKIFPINQGLNSIGFKIFTTHRLLRDQNKRKIKRKTKKFQSLIIREKISIKKVEQILNSWYGHCKTSNNYNFIQSLIKKNNFIYLSNKNVFKVNLNTYSEVK